MASKQIGSCFKNNFVHFCTLPSKGAHNFNMFQSDSRTNFDGEQLEATSLHQYADNSDGPEQD